MRISNHPHFFPDFIHGQEADTLSFSHYLINLGYDFIKASVLIGVNPIPQLTGTFKDNNLSGCQHHCSTGSRIPAFSFMFLLNTEFAEIRDQHILPGFQSAFDDFKKSFYNF
jgi:hypothetical protein